MEITVAVVALLVAIWQLNLQRKEIRLNSRVNSLIHISALLRSQIEYHERIIDSQKLKKADFSGHAYRVNNELRPLLAQVNNQLVSSVTHHTSGVDVESIREALKLQLG